MATSPSSILTSARPVTPTMRFRLPLGSYRRLPLPDIRKIFDKHTTLSENCSGDSFIFSSDPPGFRQERNHPSVCLNTSPTCRRKSSLAFTFPLPTRATSLAISQIINHKNLNPSPPAVRLLLLLTKVRSGQSYPRLATLMKPTPLQRNSVVKLRVAVHPLDNKSSSY